MWMWITYRTCVAVIEFNQKNDLCFFFGLSRLLKSRGHNLLNCLVPALLKVEVNERSLVLSTETSHGFKGCVLRQHTFTMCNLDCRYTFL